MNRRAPGRAVCSRSGTIRLALVARPRRRPAQREDEVAQFVRARRRASRLSQTALAELAGVGRRLVFDIERGKISLRLDAVNAVLRVFGKRLVVGEHGEPAP